LAGLGAAGVLLIVICWLVFQAFQGKEKRDAIANLGALRMSISVRSNDIDESGALRYAHGRAQTVGIYINWAGSLNKSQKPLRVTVSRSGAIYYDRSWTHDELPYIDRFAFEFTNTFPVGRYIVRSSVEGAPPAEYGFTVEPRPPGSVSVSDTPPGWPAQRITTLQHRPGDKKKIYVYIGVNGTIPTEGRTVYISLVHEGTPLFNYSNEVKEQNRNFYLPFESDFSEGLYTAKLSAEGDPPAEFTFTVETASPPQRSQEERSRDAAALVDRILPGGTQSVANDSAAANTEEERPSSQGSVPPPNQVPSKFSDCYNGTWHENESNQFAWNFRRVGNYLQISRTDGFVSGQFQKSSDGWTGFLNWGNGTRWDGVILHDANAACDEITTNQRWWYKR